MTPHIASQVNLRPRLSQLPADLAAIALVLWSFPRFAGLPSFPLLILIAAAAVWVARSLIRLPAAANRWWLSPLAEGTADFAAVLAIAVVTKVLAPQLSQAQACALASALALSFLTRAIGFTLLGRWASRRFLESVRWACVLFAGMYSIFPYAIGSQVGAGDAYHYSLMVSDFITQLRAGVFPVFVGQSEYAFNGGIHTLRTAPYFVHFAGLLDLASFHALSFVALTNLTIVLSAVGGAVNAYMALRLYYPTRLWSAAILSALYVLSPAILAPLYEGDMIATFMTVPFLPWWALSLACLVDQSYRRRGWLLQSVSLAALWWAHPPIAMWATAVSGLIWIGSILFRSGRIGQTIGAITSALLCAVLCGYVFVSVFSLHLPSAENPGAAAALISNISTNWKANFRPLDVTGVGLLGDIQLGYSLLVLAAAGLLCARGRASITALAVVFAGLLVVLLPIPFVTAEFWRRLPASVLEITNAWAGQRLYPILAALATFLGLAATNRISNAGKRWRLASALVVLAALFWSVDEVRKLHQRGLGVALAQDQSDLRHRPENVTLTRSSYQLFGTFNKYFSHARTEPFLETRLLDPTTQVPFADGGTALTPSTPSAPLALEFVQTETGVSDAAFLIEPHSTYLLHFDFLGNEVAGTLQIRSRTLLREYALPVSGMEKAFGSNDGGSRIVSAENRSDAPDQVRVILLSKAAGKNPGEPLARCAVERIDDTPRRLRVTSLVPFQVTVDSSRPALLETPRVFVPGYRATVNGHPENIVVTENKLTAVAIPAGRNEVRLDYKASPWLSTAYFSAISVWALLVLGTMCLPLRAAYAALRKKEEVRMQNDRT
ncbi:MAG TPA: hypothetical protein VFT72_18760, partial [Opitutaceae bacterium]|nr:hypothetical protein [Opitutaceae bacterium]